MLPFNLSAQACFRQAQMLQTSQQLFYQRGSVTELSQRKRRVEKLAIKAFRIQQTVQARCTNGNFEHTIPFPFNQTQLSLRSQQKGPRSCLPSAPLTRCRRTSFGSLPCTDLTKRQFPSNSAILMPAYRATTRVHLNTRALWLQCKCTVELLSAKQALSQAFLASPNLTIFFQLSLTSCSFHKAVCVCVCVGGGGWGGCCDYSVVWMID